MLALTKLPSGSQQEARIRLDSVGGARNRPTPLRDVTMTPYRLDMIMTRRPTLVPCNKGMVPLAPVAGFPHG